MKQVVDVTAPRYRRWMTGLCWFMALGVFVFAPLKFLPFGALGFPPYSERFVMWGYPEWFRYIIGGIELAIGLLLLMPRRRFLGAALYMFVLTGAVTTHIVNHDAFRDSASACLHLVLATIVVLGTWPADWRELYRRVPA